VFGFPTLLTSQGSNDADIDAPGAWELSQGLATTSAAAYGTPKIAVLDSGADCSEPYLPDTLVTLTANADAGSSFSGWSGDCIGAGSAIDVAMDADRLCTALFTSNPAGDAPPTASFTFECTALDCSFDGSASSEDNGVTAFEWDFGDGSPIDTGALASHGYASVGIYDVTLTVRDAVGQSSSVLVPVQVKSKGKTKGGSSGGDGGGGGGNCPPGKAAQGKC